MRVIRVDLGVPILGCHQHHAEEGCESCDDLYMAFCSLLHLKKRYTKPSYRLSGKAAVQFGII